MDATQDHLVAASLNAAAMTVEEEGEAAVVCAGIAQRKVLDRMREADYGTAASSRHFSEEEAEQAEQADNAELALHSSVDPVAEVVEGALFYLESRADVSFYLATVSLVVPLEAQPNRAKADLEEEVDQVASVPAQASEKKEVVVAVEEEEAEKGTTVVLEKSKQQDVALLLKLLVQSRRRLLSGSLKYRAESLEEAGLDVSGTADHLLISNLAKNLEMLNSHGLERLRHALKESSSNTIQFLKSQFFRRYMMMDPRNGLMESTPL